MDKRTRKRKNKLKPKKLNLHSDNTLILGQNMSKT